MNIRERLLQSTLVYKTFKNLVSPPHLVERTIENFMTTAPGSRVLDLGCGYGDIAPYFTDRCTYIGIDSNPSYIAEAKRRNQNSSATFILGDITADENLDLGVFDLVIVSGVLHHLPAVNVAELAKAISPLLSATGRLVAVEPVFSPDQRLSARLIIAADRGRYARDEEGYISLLSQGFRHVTTQVDHGLLRIPYSHVILTCSNSSVN